MVTDKEARQKQCRLINGFPMRVQGLGGDQAAISTANCCGSDCMAWRWGNPWNKDEGGYCGLVRHKPAETSQ